MTIARTLSHSLHVRVASGGHSPNGLDGLGCLDDLHRSTIEQGRDDGLDTSCVTRIKRRGFVPSMSGGRLVSRSSRPAASQASKLFSRWSSSPTTT